LGPHQINQEWPSCNYFSSLSFLITHLRQLSFDHGVCARNAQSLQLDFTALSARDTSTPKYNPLEKLPILLTDDGNSVYEPRYILEYLKANHPSPPPLPENIKGVLAAKQFEVLADGVCDAFVLIYWERARLA
jgi:glutathione S-transferase